MATKKYDKVKLGLPAYITFAAFVVAIILMIILVIPSEKKKTRKLFTGSYTVTGGQSDEAQTEYYDVGEDHILKTYSFKNLKKQLKKDKYTYVMYGDTTSTDFCLSVIKMNDLGKELGIDKLIIVDSKKLNDDKKDYLRDRLKKVNTEITSVSKMPSMDLWVFKGDELIDCVSNPDYDEVDSDNKLSMIARYHIFSYKN